MLGNRGPILYAVLLGYLAGVGCVEKHQREQRVCRDKGRNVVEAKFVNETHWLCLKLISLGKQLRRMGLCQDDTCRAYGYEVESMSHLLCDCDVLAGKRMSLLGMAYPKPEDYRHLPLKGSNHVVNSHTALLLDPDGEDTNTTRGFPDKDIHMVRGYPLADPAGGSAEGYIAEDNQFYGLLHIHNRTLHADPYGKDDLSRTYGPYDETYEPPPKRRARDNKAQVPYFDFKLEESRRRPGVAHARICELLLLADQKFLQIDANGSLNHATMRMVHAVDQADVIFRNADFDEDGVPDNIGFSIKYIIVLASAETTTRVFGSLLDEQTVDGHEYLMRFARLRRLADVCLGVAFSGHAFLNRTLGLSFTSLGGGLGFAAGGICDRRAFGRSFNTIALAHATKEFSDKFRIPERVVALTLAHEMGHSFGAHHDDNFPNPECHGYLMSSQSVNASVLRNYQFSFCSKRLIAATVAGMGYCLLQEDKPFCGNGIVEEGEACDCGHPSGCVERDRCCTPRSGSALLLHNSSLDNEGCMVAPAAECHPSQGFCCENNCKFANLTEFGINCLNQQLPCNCSSNSSLCHCGLGGRCMPDGTCHAAECTMLGLRECRCPRGTMDGEIRAQGSCGTCCKLPSRRAGPSCVGAEAAAHELLRRGTPIPQDWPDDDYQGPNVTIKLCVFCANRTLRAWPMGGYCVTKNQVGVCSLQNQCRPGIRLPRRNIFPETQALKFNANGNGDGLESPLAVILLNCVLNIINKL